MNIELDKETFDIVITAITAIFVISIALVISVKMKNTIGKIKKLRKAILDLKSSHKLNEERLKELKERFIKYTISIFAITLLLSLVPGWVEGGVTGAIFIFSLGIIFWLNVINFNAERYLLYTVGEKALAEVILGEWREGIYFNKYYFFEYFYYDEKGENYTNKHMHHNINTEDFMTLDKGDKIEILYLKENPKIATPLSKFNQEFNLRKI